MTANGTQPNPIPASTDVTTDSVSVAFPDAGTYGYYCMHHGHDAVGTAAAMSGGIYVVQ
jgi:plastocyanin